MYNNKILKKVLLRFANRINKDGAGSKADYKIFEPIDIKDLLYNHDRNMIFEVDRDLTNSMFYFSYSQDGWHPFTATLKQFINKPDLKYENSILKKYYDAYQPKTLCEAFFEGENNIKPLNAIPPKTAYFPWSLYKVPLKAEKGFDISQGVQHFGPVSPDKGKLEFARLINTYESIKENGYIINIKDMLKVTFLISEQEIVFLLIGGKHRAAALSVLGYKKLPVTFKTTWPRAIFLEDIKKWPQVKQGHIPIDLAERLFLRYFDEKGKSKARKISADLLD